MNPYQLVSARWPLPVKRKCFDMYILGHTAPEIEKVTGVPPATIYDWGRNEDWPRIRRETVIDYQGRAQDLLAGCLSSLGTSIRVAEKLLLKIEDHLDRDEAPTPSAAPQGALRGMENNDQVSKEQVSQNGDTSLLSDKGLKDLASALQSTSDVVFRAFGK